MHWSIRTNFRLSHSKRLHSLLSLKFSFLQPFIGLFLGGHQFHGGCQSRDSWFLLGVGVIWQFFCLWWWRWCGMVVWVLRFLGRWIQWRWRQWLLWQIFCRLHRLWQRQWHWLQDVFWTWSVSYWIWQRIFRFSFGFDCFQRICRLDLEWLPTRQGTCHRLFHRSIRWHQYPHWLGWLCLPSRRN